MTLGRGLSALLGEADELESTNADYELSVDQLKSGKYQPRKDFDSTELKELSDSIADKGVLQPILVRPLDRNQYEIIAGERRWRAAKMAKLDTVPVIIRDFDEKTAYEVALIENIQRDDLKPLEEAKAYAYLLEHYHETKDSLANSLGKSRTHVTNLIRLLGLPTNIKKDLNIGKLSMGHGRALLASSEPEQLAKQCIRESWSVRQLEQAVRTEKKQPIVRIKHEKPSEHAILERQIAINLGARVDITRDGDKGRIVLNIKNHKAWDDIVERLRS